MSAPAKEATRRTQAERTATAARRMLRAAGSLIARQGYTKTSLAQVGKQAGYTGGLVSHHFGSKEGLLRELVGNITGRFYSDQLRPAIDGATGVDAICATARAYLAELRLREERMRTLYRAARRTPHRRADGREVPKLVYLDMEAYGDLELTLATFRRVLDEPEFHDWDELYRTC